MAGIRLFNPNHTLMQPKYWISLFLLASIVIVSVACSIGDNHDFEFAKREILLRRIGHEILLQAGDSTSRVLPIKKVAEHTYEISFEQAISFQPELLVNTTHQLLSKDPVTANYIVNVVKRSDTAVTYGYAVFGNKKDDIITCLGRKQPKACYRIQIKFQPPITSTTIIGYWLGGLMVFLVIGYGVVKVVQRSSFINKRNASTEATVTDILPELALNTNTDKLVIGSLLFDVAAGKLFTGDNEIDLTKTETRILAMLALTPNVVVARSRLQKEIWEDEGVIVGRSLDMFISKLRKKLETDPSIKITVVRGKGYQLETKS